MNRRSAWLLLALTAAGCSTTPAYRTPAVVIPASFREAPGWRPAAPADDRPRGVWWAGLADPTLDALASQVESANQTVAAAAAAYGQAQALVREQRAALLPTAGISASGTRAGSFGSGGSRVVVTDPGTGTGTGSGTGTTVTTGSSSASRRYRATVSASWEPDLWGRIGASVSQVRAQAESARADLGNAVLAAQGELALDYLELRSLDLERRILDETVQAYARALTITENRYRAGVVARVDVLQAETQLRNARADAADLGRQRALLEHAIAVLVGAAPSTFAIAPVADWKPTVPEVPAILPATLLERRPDVASAERAVAAANAGIGIERAAFFPSLSLSADAGVSAASLGGLAKLSNTVWSLGFDGLFTLLDFGARSARVAAARAAYEQTVANYRQTVLVAFREVEDQLAAVRTFAEVGAERQAAAEAATRSETIVTNQYLAGQVSYTDVITAQATALAARRAALTATLDRQTAAVALAQAIGGGWDGGRDAAAR